MRGKKAVLYIFLCLALFAAGLGSMLYFSHGNTDLTVENKEKEINTAGNDTGTAGGTDERGAKAQEALNEAKKPQGRINIEQDAAEFEESLRQLRQQNDRIVVLDAGCGGQQDGITVSIDKASGQELLKEKELTLALALACKNKLEAEGVYVVMTREDDREVSADSRVYLANAIPADFFISLHAFEDKDSSVYGMRVSYNDEFYMQGFDNEELAYTLLESTAEAANEKALGVFTQQEDTELRLLMIPGARLDVGCMTNMQQARLLERDDYREKVAEGIAGGILKTFEKMEGKDKKDD